MAPVYLARFGPSHFCAGMVAYCHAPTPCETSRMQRRMRSQTGLTPALQGPHGRVNTVICHIFESNMALAQSGWAQAAIKTIANNFVLAGGAVGHRHEAPPDDVLTRLAHGLVKRLCERDVTLA
jgi:hypothetical protein